MAKKGNTKKKLTLELEAYDKGMKVGLKQAKDELINLNKAAEKSKKELSKSEAAMAKLSAQARTGKEALKGAKNQIQYLNTEAKKNKAALSKSEAAFRKLNREVKQNKIAMYKAQAQMKKSRSGFKSLGTSAGGAATSIANLVAAYGAFRGARAAVTVVTDFNAKMAEVSTLTDASKASLEGLSKNIINLSTKLPQTAGELATATYDIISAGVSLKDTTTVLEASAKAAIAGVTDTQTAVNAGVGVMNAYGQEVDSLDEIYDTLFQTVKLGVVKFADLAANIGKVTPIARSAGVDFKSLSAAVATLTKSGLKAEIATTGLRGAITALSSPTPQAKKAMQELGITWTTLEGTIKQIADKNLGAEVMRQIIPDVRARTAVLSLSANYDTLKDSLSQMNQAAGSTEAAFAKMIDTIDNKFKLLKSTVVAAILKNKDFSESLDTLADKSSGAAAGIGTLTSSLLTFSSHIVTGWAALVSYHDAFWDLNEVTLALNKSQSEWETRLAAVNTATGLNIKSSQEMFELIKLGVIEYDKQSGVVKANAVNLGLYKDGLLEAGTAGKDFVKSGTQMTDEMGFIGDEIADLETKAKTFGKSFAAVGADMAGVGDEIAGLSESTTKLSAAERTALQNLVDESVISLGKLTAAGRAESAEFIAIQKAMNAAQKRLIADRNATASKSYDIDLANLKLALAKGILSQKEFNRQMLALNKQHWSDEVKTLSDALAETKAKLDAGKIEYSEYEAAVLKLKEAQIKLAEASSTADDAMEAAGKTGKEAGTVAGSTAGAAAAAWQALADQIGMTVADTKDALAAIGKDINDTITQLDKARMKMNQWAKERAEMEKKRTARKSFSTSAKAQVDKFNGADDSAIRDEINRQQKIIYSLSEWVSPEQKQTARDVINALEQLLKDRRGFASGGTVPGSGSGDTVPAMLTPGEFVVKKAVVKALGLDFFAAINRGLLPKMVQGFNLGGLVAQMPRPQINLPALNLPVQRLASGGAVQNPMPGETITVNLNLSGADHAGIFPKDEGLALIDALQTAAHSMH